MAEGVQLNEDQKRLIETLGVYHEKSGNQPAASRILALLLVSPKTELSFDEIREVLNLSKSATSNGINLLLNTERIDYVTHPGDRKRYFKSKLTSWRSDVKIVLQKFTKGAEVLEEVLKHRPKETVEFNQHLAEVIDFLKFLNTELPEVFKKWEASKK